MADEEGNLPPPPDLEPQFTPPPGPGPSPRRTEQEVVIPGTMPANAIEERRRVMVCKSGARCGVEMVYQEDGPGALRIFITVMPEGTVSELYLDRITSLRGRAPVELAKELAGLLRDAVDAVEAKAIKAAPESAGG